MADMKLENYTGSSQTFTFPNNSTSFEDASEFQNSLTPVPFDNKHIVITKGALSPKTISLQGYFTGVDKLDNWNELLELSSSSNLKKFYFASDRFYIVMSSQFKQTRTGGRNNFIDYVGAMFTPIPFVFSSTLKSATYDGSSWTDGTQKNEGTHQTFVESVEVFLSTNVSDSTLIINTNGNGHGGIEISLPPTSSGDILRIDLIDMVDSNGYKTSEYWYCTINGTQIQRGISSGKTELDLVIQSIQDIDSLFISGTTAYSLMIFKWRDSFLA